MTKKQVSKLDREYRDWRTLEDIDGAVQEMKKYDMIIKEAYRQGRKEMGKHES